MESTKIYIDVKAVVNGVEHECELSPNTKIIIEGSLTIKDAIAVPKIKNI